MCIFAHKGTLKKLWIKSTSGGGFPPKSNVPVFFFLLLQSPMFPPFMIYVIIGTVKNKDSPHL